MRVYNTTGQQTGYRDDATSAIARARNAECYTVPEAYCIDLR